MKRIYLGNASRVRPTDETERWKRDSFWGAHAPRVLAMAPSPSRTFLFQEHCGEAPQWTREARALPRTRYRSAISAGWRFGP